MWARKFQILLKNFEKSINLPAEQESKSCERTEQKRSEWSTILAANEPKTLLEIIEK